MFTKGFCHPERSEGSRAGTWQETFARCFTSFNMTNYALDNSYIIAKLKHFLYIHSLKFAFPFSLYYLRSLYDTRVV